MSKTVRSFEELVAALVAEQVPHVVIPEKQTLKLRTAADALGNELIVRWEKLLPFVQIIQPMIASVPDDRIRDVETAIIRINNVAVFPGLELDHAGRLVYFRITMSVLVDGVREDLFKAYLRGAVHDAQQLLPVMQAVVAGSPGEDVLAQLKSGRAN